MYENDPNRLDRPTVRREVEASSGAGIVAGVLAAALIVLLAFSLWPSSDNRTGTNVSENTRVERAPTTTPPANKPATPTTPAPSTPPQ
jgi:hypothetical protein